MHAQLTAAGGPGGTGDPTRAIQDRARNGPVARPCLLARTESQSGRVPGGGSDGSADTARQKVCMKSSQPGSAATWTEQSAAQGGEGGGQGPAWRRLPETKRLQSPVAI